MELFAMINAVLLYWLLNFPLASAAKRLLRPEDIVHITEVQELVVSPSGRYAVYTRGDYDNVTNSKQRSHSAWHLDISTNASRKLFNNTAPPNFSWAPDESMSCYLAPEGGRGPLQHGAPSQQEGPSQQERPPSHEIPPEQEASPNQGGPPHEEKSLQLHCARSGESQATVLTHLSEGVDTYVWSPNSKHIALTTKIPASTQANTLPGVHVFTNAIWGIGGSYRHFFKSVQIWTIDVSDAQPAKPKLLSTINNHTILAGWSANSSAVLYTTDSTLERYYQNNTITLHSTRVPDGQDLWQLPLTIPGREKPLDTASKLALSPDGTKLAYSCRDPRAPEQFAQMDICLLDLTTRKVAVLTKDFDFDIFPTFKWGNDTAVFSIAYVLGNAVLVEIDVETHKITHWQQERLTVREFAVITRTRGEPRVLVVAVSLTAPVEIYSLQKSAPAKMLTSFHSWFRSEFDISPPDPIQFTGPGGQRIHGFLHKPPNFDPSQKYPLLLRAHGGPFDSWNQGFDAETKVYTQTSSSYLVLEINPRGSSSYGQAFSAALDQNWPGYDYDDLMAGLDYLLSSPPYMQSISPSHLALQGASAGGLLTDWAITHTTRFRAAVSLSDIADFAYLQLVNDQPADFDRSMTPPWKNGTSISHSPINYVSQNMTTPTLFIMGDSDFTTPPAIGSQPMFRILKFYRIPTALVVFEKAGHTVQGPDPRFPGKVMEYTIKWLDLHLFGKAAGEFENLEVL